MSQMVVIKSVGGYGGEKLVFMRKSSKNVPSLLYLCLYFVLKLHTIHAILRLLCIEKQTCLV